MGICFVAITATDEMIERLHGEPPLFWRLYAPEEPAFYWDAIGAGKKPGFLSRLFGAKEIPIPDPLPAFEYEEGARKEVDLDKSWDGINFCLKALCPGGPNLFEDGKAVGEVDVGYGPAMTFSAADTKTVAESYLGIAATELLSVLQASAMGDVYPKAVWERSDQDTQDYLTENFTALQAFLEFAVAKKLGTVVVYA